MCEKAHPGIHYCSLIILEKFPTESQLLIKSLKHAVGYWNSIEIVDCGLKLLYFRYI